jgi:hypothetical protein
MREMISVTMSRIEEHFPAAPFKKRRLADHV